MQAEAEAKVLKEEVGLLGPRTPSRRYPEELRGRLTAWATSQRAAGVPAKDIAEGVGVPWESLAAWMGGRKRASGARAQLRRVRVVDTRPSVAGPAANLVLRTPKGYAVEGLTLEAATELLSRLL